MRIEKTALDAQNRCVYSLYKEKGCIGHAVTCADCFEALEIAPEWQSRGYGSYLLREVLRQNGGFDRTAPSEFTAPLPDAGNTAAQALAAKFGFVPRDGEDAHYMSLKEKSTGNLYLLTCSAYEITIMFEHVRTGEAIKICEISNFALSAHTIMNIVIASIDSWLQYGVVYDYRKAQNFEDYLMR